MSFYTSQHSLIRRFAAAALICTAIGSSISAEAATVDASADGNSYLVTGGVIHHSNYTKDRTEAALCTTCHWRINIICSSWDDARHGWCPSMLLQCPRDQKLAEVFRADALVRPDLTSSLWHRTGYTCLVPGGPASVVRIRQSLTDNWRIPVPPLKLVTKPPTNTLIGLPTKIHVLSALELPDKAKTVAGIPVIFRAQAVRRLSCGLRCSVNAQHSAVTFSRLGAGRVLTVVSWTAHFDALGLENIPVSDSPIVQRVESFFTVSSLHRTLIKQS